MPPDLTHLNDGLRTLQAIAFDVDGVLTDGTLAGGRLAGSRQIPVKVPVIERGR